MSSPSASANQQVQVFRAASLGIRTMVVGMLE